MADKMIERLEAMVQRVNDIDAMLCEESIVSDVRKLTSLNKERASLNDAVEEYLAVMEDEKNPKISEENEIKEEKTKESFLKKIINNFKERNK